MSGQHSSITHSNRAWPVAIGERIPRRGNAFTVGLARLVYGLFGWRVTGELPNVPKAVVIVAPHTSNWDGIFGLFGIQLLRLRVNFLGKGTLFKGPLGWLLRTIGGIPLARTGNEGMVETTVQAFNNREALWLAIAPEGTRKRADRFRQGFHHIAHASNVPIVIVAFDYAHRELAILGTLYASEDIDSDMAHILALYKPIQPKCPERLSEPLRQ